MQLYASSRAFTCALILSSLLRKPANSIYYLICCVLALARVATNTLFQNLSGQPQSAAQKHSQIVLGENFMQVRDSIHFWSVRAAERQAANVRLLTGCWSPRQGCLTLQGSPLAGCWVIQLAA